MSSHNPSHAALNALWERHRAENPDHNGRRFCERCFQPWPCDAIRLGDAWHGALVDLAALRAEVDKALGVTITVLGESEGRDG